MGENPISRFLPDFPKFMFLSGFRDKFDPFRSEFCKTRMICYKALFYLPESENRMKKYYLELFLSNI